MIPSRIIEYLCIGHLTEDLTDDGVQLGGTAAYSTLTAQAFGLSCGLISSYKERALPSEFNLMTSNLQITEQMIQFENRYQGDTRTQHLRHNTKQLSLPDLNTIVKQTEILHFGPILNDFPIEVIRHFPDNYVALTPQGWLRTVEKGVVKNAPYTILYKALPYTDAVVISQEDIDYNQQAVRSIAKRCKLLVITNGFHGAEVIWQGKRRSFQASRRQEVDPTGAGDIFAAIFFILNFHGYSPWEAGKIATEIAALTVTRKGLQSIPKSSEILNTIYKYSTSETN